MQGICGTFEALTKTLISFMSSEMLQKSKVQRQMKRSKPLTNHKIYSGDPGIKIQVFSNLTTATLVNLSLTIYQYCTVDCIDAAILSLVFKM